MKKKLFVFLIKTAMRISITQIFPGILFTCASFAKNAAGQAYALSAIYYERKIELAMEGHRFFDLVRWGLAEKELNVYFNFQRRIQLIINLKYL